MDFTSERAYLIDQLRTQISDSRVLEAMGRIPREAFVPEKYSFGAYFDEPLPIGENQTISQPYIIALMTQALKLKGNEKVLEIGTGSGYQTAILASLAREVISTERIPALAEKARIVLDNLGFRNIKIFVAGDELGFKPEAPFDAIIVTAGAPTIPDVLMKQLAEGGRMVIPVGSRFTQELLQVIKSEKGTRVNNLGACRFVPLIGKGAWEENPDAIYDTRDRLDNY